MATRFYFNNEYPDFAPATSSGTWNTGHISGITTTLSLDPFKSGGPLDVRAVNEGSSFPAANFVLVLRGISGKLAAQTLNANANAVMGVVAFNATTAYGWRVVCYITQGDTDLIRGATFGAFQNGAALPWPTVAQGKAFTLTTGGPKTVLAGDRLVIELGYNTAAPTNPSNYGAIYYGTVLNGVGTPDLTPGDTQVLNSGFIEFDQTILFAPADVSHVGHVSLQVAKTAPPNASQLSHVVAQVVRAPTLTTSLLSHVIVQTVPVVAPPLPDISGLYFLNPRKAQQHDSYYGQAELKIPDPIIRTALLGE